MSVAGSGGSGDGARWRVFLSHTSELRDYPRQSSYVAAAERAISAAGHVVVDMTGFPAAGQPPARVCAERVRGCDVYIGVLGTRYGSLVRDRPEVSYTELEFDTAAEAGLDQLVFLLDTGADDVGIPPTALIDHEFVTRQAAFRRRVQESGLTTQSFASPAELGQLVERSLRELAGTRRDTGGGSGREQVRGWPLAEVRDPFALEVHRAIEASAAGWPDLPVYVVREHDQHLARVVAEAAGGTRRMAVLVGDSSTGKTRACWEALYLLRERPEPWRLWHPIDPTRPDAALADLPRIGSYTVVWLNEAQHYLMPADTGLSERIAAGLRTLLHDTTRGAVLILATMWPQYWKEVTARPAKSQPDPYAQARELVNTGTLIHVADEFTPAELSTLNIAGVDPRLRVAAAHAEAGRITQYLAGAPELENRYRTAEPVERALMHVAMDARRLGHPPDIARALFERATPGYLDKTTWSTVGGNWLGALDTVLAGLGESVHGIRGPISPNYPQPAESTVGDTPRYRLADYLEQLGRRERGGVYPPDSLWTTFTTAGEPDLLRQLGKQAEDRGRFQHAVRLYIQAADRDAAARHALARLREQAGASAAEALDRLARRDTYVGGPEYVASAVELALDRQDADRIRLGTGALHDLAARQEQAGDDEGAAALYRQAAVRGDTGALCALARLREQAGDGEGAKAWAVRAAARGDTSALDDLARRRESVGNRVEAEALAVLAADYGNTETLWFLAWLRDQAGNAEAAEALAVQVADRSGNAGVLSALAAMRALAGDTDSAEALHRQGADRGRTGSMRELARLRHRAGYTDDADALYREAIDCGDSNALLELAELRESVGDSDGAGRLLRFGLTGDGKIATMLDFASYGGLVGGSGVLTV